MKWHSSAAAIFGHLSLVLVGDGWPERPHDRCENAIFGKVFLQISKKSGCLLRPLGL
jgi:hypothetical protein